MTRAERAIDHLRIAALRLAAARGHLVRMENGDDEAEQRADDALAEAVDAIHEAMDAF